MSVEEIIGVGVGFTVIGGAIVGVVRWLDKGKLISDIADVKERVVRLEVEAKENAANDQLLRETVIRIEASHDGLNKSMDELKGMIKDFLAKLEAKQDEMNLINNKIAVLEEKTK